MLLTLLAACGPIDVVLGDDQNYSFDSDLTIQNTQIAEYSEATIDWSALTTDMLGQDVDPASDISEVAITRFARLSYEELAEKIDAELDENGNCNGLLQADVSGNVDYTPAGNTSALLSEFDFLGTPMDPTVEMDPDSSYLMYFATEGISSYRTLAHIDPDPDSTNTLVEVGSDSTIVDYTVDLDSMARIPVKKRRSGYVVDWTGLTKDMGGCELKLSDITTLRLAYYDISVDELAADFLRLEFLAAELYEADVEGLPSYDLAEMWTDGGKPFGGFTGKDGTWILALLCGDCTNPAPVFLGILDVASEG